MNLIIFVKYKKNVEIDACNTLPKSWGRGKFTTG